MEEAPSTYHAKWGGASRILTLCNQCSWEVYSHPRPVLKRDGMAIETVEEGGFFRHVWGSLRLFFKGIFG